MREKIEFTPDYGSKANSSIIKVIGVGGGGGNAVKHMYKEGIVGVDFMICNTDQQALYNNPVPFKLVLGSSGLGAGANPEVARELAEESVEALKEFIGAETQMLFIAAGMGKGTGTGAAPVVARIAREMNILTIGVVTIPFAYEGTRCANQAMAGIAEIKKHVDSLIVIKNEKIFTYYKNVPFNESFGYVDDVLKNAVKCIAELITVNATVNVDFNDVKSVMANSNSAMLGIATANGENRIEEVIARAFLCPLLDLDLISEAKNLLFFISCGTEEPLTTNELNALTQNFERYVGENVRVIWGYGDDAELGKDIKLSIILTNYETAEQQKKEDVIKLPELPELPETPEIPETPKTPDIPEVLGNNNNSVAHTTTEGIITKPIDRTNFDDSDEFLGQNRVQQHITNSPSPVSDHQSPAPNPHVSTPNTSSLPPTQTQSPQPRNPFDFTTQATVQKQLVLDNGQMAMYAPNDDIYEDDEQYDRLINTPAIQLTRNDVVEKLIEKPEKVSEFNPFQNKPDNDANEFLGFWPD
jgi:cell division protein FtsZ